MKSWEKVRGEKNDPDSDSDADAEGEIGKEAGASMSDWGMIGVVVRNRNRNRWDNKGWDMMRGEKNDPDSDSDADAEGERSGKKTERQCRIGE